MKAEIYIVILAMMVLTLSVGIVNAADPGVYVMARTVGVDKNISKEVVMIDITTNQTGHLKYVEWYYSKNETGKYNRDLRVLHFNDTISNNVVILKIKRPLDPQGKPYSVIRALMYIDDKLVLNSVFKSADALNTQQEKKSPDFEILIAIVSILSIVYLIKWRNK